MTSKLVYLNFGFVLDQWERVYKP